MGVGSHGSSSLPRRFRCIRQSQPNQKAWRGKKKQAKGQPGSFGNHFWLNNLSGSPVSLAEAQWENIGNKVPPLCGGALNPYILNSPVLVVVEAFLALLSYRFLEKDALKRCAPSLVIDTRRGPERPRPTN